MALAAALAAAALAQAGTPEACAALARAPVAGAQVTSVAPVRAGLGNPSFCRVVLESRPRPGSRIGTEVWLPLEGWTGRYVQLGTGGFAGTIPEAGLAAELRRGNAVAVTDSGHRGADGFDASWALGAPEAVKDYGYRSLDISARAAKAVTAAFYGRAPRYSYFVGCSNGGRQALMAAERYPEQWDGVLAGSPAVRWAEQLSSFARIQQALRSPGGMISAAKLPAIAQAAGDRDRLRCRGPGTAACLTAPQLAALRRIARDFDPRWASVRGGWDQWIVNPDRAVRAQQLTLAEQFFGFMALGRPGWRVEDLRPADLDRARAFARVLDPSADLGRFSRYNGKVLIYAGTADPVISPQSALDYYRSVGGRGVARLFMVPGMLHCQGGDAPNAFGQAPVAPALRPDPEHDVRMALERWVEQALPPERLIAVKYRGDDPAKGVAATTVVHVLP